MMVAIDHHEKKMVQGRRERSESDQRKAFNGLFCQAGETLCETACTLLQKACMLVFAHKAALYCVAFAESQTQPLLKKELLWLLLVLQQEYA